MQLDASLLDEDAQELYENAPCGYLSTLPDGTIVKVNRTFVTWLGYEREELLSGMRFQDLLSVAGKIFYETHVAPLMRMQGYVNELAFDLVGANQRPIPALLNAVQKRDEIGRPLLHRITVFNAADRRRYERELLLARNKAQQSAKAKADLLAMISHDIRSPLAAIMAGTALLEKTEMTPKQRKYVGVLKASSETLLALTNNLLDYSKIEAGAVQLEEHAFGLRDMVGVLMEGLNGKAEEKGIALVAEIDPDLPRMVTGDSVKIGQVLTNLLSNALKFTERGSITLRLVAKERHNEAVTIGFSVADTGIGIPRDRLEHIFDEFAQASHDIARKYGGSGLGLAISRRLLALYGSNMAVESTVGEGTCFSFSLRLKLPPQAA